LVINALNAALGKSLSVGSVTSMVSRMAALTSLRVSAQQSGAVQSSQIETGALPPSGVPATLLPAGLLSPAPRISQNSLRSTSILELRPAGIDDELLRLLATQKVNLPLAVDVQQ
jgi:hypothetical protein